jgi:spore maturation protein CgeB
MRFLIVDHYYDAVVDWIYSREPGLARGGYAAQRVRIDAALFGQTAFQVAALRGLGHEASDALVNVRPLQEAWAREHGLRLGRQTRWGVRRRRGWIPWPRRPDARWMGQALLSQVRAARPDVVHIESMDLLEPDLVAAVRRETRFVVGQVATELPTDRAYGSYDLVVSSIPNLVDRFRQSGGDAEYLALAFEPALLEVIPQGKRDVAVSFVGSFSARYADRTAIVEAVAGSAPLKTWTGDATVLPRGSAITPTIQGAAWGREMFEVLARSRLTLNTHGRISGNAANNLRLFEATGMGAVLITDARSNLGGLFEVGQEVVAYRDPRECAEVVQYLLGHPEEADSIAAAGRRRTLRDHTWSDRMGRLVEMVRHRI